MSTVKYKVTELALKELDYQDQFLEKDENLIESFSINTKFDTSKHNLALYIYTPDDTLLSSNLNYTQYSLLLNAAGAGKSGSENVTIDPINDAKISGFESGDIRLLYKFTDDLFSEDTSVKNFFIESISPDRTELRALSNSLTDDEIATKVRQIQTKLNDGSFFSEFNLNFPTILSTIGINIDTEQTSKGLAVVFKLYEPLNNNVSVKEIFNVVETVSDSKYYEISSEYIADEISLNKLKGPNFNIEITDENNNPSEFLSYNELLSYPVTNSYFELRSLFNDNSAQIAIDHTDFGSFIHFSSAEERLRNFKYKLDLIHSYESSIDSIKATGYTKMGITGSVDYYEKLIDGLVNNFDHYDRFLFYESGSYSWPKSTTERPHKNQLSNTTNSVTFFNNSIVSASNYDNTNVDILTNTIPTFIREDANNTNYSMFVNMVAHHFDNLWIYFKAVSDKYDADNRLNFGVSKDLVKEAIQSLGVKLYDSNQSLDNLFSIFTGESYVTGSENITEIVSPVSGSVSKGDYLKEVYKRIYHNLPLITKGKGTERGIRAIVNSFGIPSEILPLKIYGGQDKNQARFTGENYVTSSIGKVRLENTGSYISGSTLTQYSSTLNRDGKYTDDLHLIELGFDINEPLNTYFKNRLPVDFNIDNYIGDPRDEGNTSYADLVQLRDRLLESETEGVAIWDAITRTWEQYTDFWNADLIQRTPSAFVRLVKFFDNSIFRAVKDLIPARSTINTGVVVKQDILTRNKAKQVSVSLENQIYTASIAVGNVTGSHGESFGYKQQYNTNYSSSLVTPLGRVERNVVDQSPKFTGEFSGSLVIAADGELNTANSFKKAQQPILDFNITVFNLSLAIPPSCDLNLRATYIGDILNFYGEGEGVNNRGTVRQIYPETTTAVSGSIAVVNDYTIYEYVSVIAEGAYYGGGAYAGVFDGWYTQAQGSGSLLTTGSTLTLDFETQTASGSHYYANFVDS